MFPPYGRRIHLHDARPPEGRAPLARDPQGDLSLLLSRRQDRRPRRQRRGQVLPAPHHGGRRQGFPGRRAPAPGHPDRVPDAGAPARRDEGRPRQRHGGRPRAAGDARPVQRDQRQVRRADGRRRDDPAAREAGQSPGAHRRARPLGARPQDRSRDGRAPAPAGRRRRGEDLGRRAPPRGALPAAARGAGHAAARRAHQPPRRRKRLVARALPRGVQGHRRRRHPRPLLPRQRGRLDSRALSGRRDPVGGELLLVARAEAAAAGAGGEAGLGPAEDLAAGARVGAHVARAPARPRARRASPATRSCARKPSGRPRGTPRS